MKLIDDDFDWGEYSEAPERAKVIPASRLADEVIQTFYGDTKSRGDFLPWAKSHDRLRLRNREVTVYSGINGHGKSLVTSQITLGLLRQDVRVLMASFEMRPAQTMHRMTRQAACTESPATEYIRAFHRWTDNRLWIYDHFGTCDPQRVLAVCRYAARELGVAHIFVDSLMKVIAATDDYSGQKIFVGDLCALALTYNLHVHLITHARKGEKERDEIDKFSIRGAGEIADQADNIVLVQRNKRKEAKIAAGTATGDEHDQFLTVAKQRNGEFEGTMGLWFEQKSMSYVDSANATPTPFMLRSNDPEADAERTAIQACG